MDDFYTNHKCHYCHDYAETYSKICGDCSNTLSFCHRDKLMDIWTNYKPAGATDEHFVIGALAILENYPQLLN